MKYEEIDWCNLNKYKSVKNLEGEIWKASSVINSYFYCVGLYEASNYGRVRRSDTLFVYSITDNGSGYKKVVLGNNALNRKSFYIHRLVANGFLPNPYNLPQVNHKKTGLGKFDNRVKHLEWCSERDNIKNAHSNGLMDNRTKVYTKTDKKPDCFVEKMYRRYKDTGRITATAIEFGVSRTTLSSIVNKRSRVDITDKIDKEYEQNKGENNANVQTM